MESGGNRDRKKRLSSLPPLVSDESTPAKTFDGDRRLPRGLHELPREAIVGNQRQRLTAGAARALVDHGYSELTVEHVLTEAGVSRMTFYENFADKRECVLTAHEAALDRFVADLVGACARKSEWPAKVAAGVNAAIAFVTARPEEARLLIVDPVAADPTLASRVLASQDHLVGMLRSGREQSSRAASLPELTERALVGAASSVIGSRLLAGQADRLQALGPELIQLMLMPYVGATEARQIVEAG
jgi:AcrR family transcriptional regulator